MDTPNTAAAALRERLERLPLVDAGVFEIIALLNDPRSTFEQLVAKLTPDITARFLNLANSAYYGVEVRSVAHAVKLLGFNAMRQNLITSFLIEHLTKQLDLARFDFEAFQERARVAAALARSLGEVLDVDGLGDLYTAALLHGIGTLVAAVHFPEGLREIDAAGEADREARQEMERWVLGADLAQIGALALERFNIPPAICQAVRFHRAAGRKVADSEHFELEFLVREAVSLASRLRVPEGPAWERFQEALKPAAAEGRRAQREILQGGLQSSGYQESFPALLAAVSRVLETCLESFQAEGAAEAWNGAEGRPPAAAEAA